MSSLDIPPPRARRRLLALTGSVSLVLAACGGSGGSALCAPEDRIIEPSAIHVLGDTEVTYSSSPPTSGPHQIPAPPLGVSAAPVSEPLQVGALESGAVLVQYQATVDADGVASLEALAATEGVLVAPAVRAFDDDAAVAFSAWGVRQLCTAVDLDAAETFIDDHLGMFFVNHP